MADNIVPGLIGVQTKVREFFGWEYQSDLNSANLMAESLNSDNPLGVEIWSPKNRISQFEKLKHKLLAAPRVVVVGASVNDDDFLGFDFENSVVIAADGSIGGVVEFAEVACVVTDFDGNPHLDKAAESGAVFVAHAHGDNISQWQECLDKWRILQNPPALILSHQVDEAIDGMYNYGGFTDGDRAVCLAIGLGVPAEKISLIGFSTTKIGQWSGQTNPEKKLQKLAWMLRVLQILGLEEQVDSNVYEGI